MPYAHDGHDVPKYVTGSDKKRRQWSHVWNSEYKRQKDKGKSDKEAEQIAFAAANGVAGPNTKKYEKLLAKASKSEADEFAEAIIEAIQQDFLGLPGEIRPPLTDAMLSGMIQGMMQIESGTTAGLSSANDQAEDYARDRAAEMVGKKYDLEGNLVDNPDAKWAISETTRQAIRDIVADSFTMDTPMSEIVEDIQEALEDETTGNGIFSEGRAKLIARTEIMRSQIAGNYSVWEKSGTVKTLRWLTSEDESVCEDCSSNDEVVRPLGKPFPSGAMLPGDDHPLCRCVLVVNSVNE